MVALPMSVLIFRRLLTPAALENRFNNAVITKSRFQVQNSPRTLNMLAFIAATLVVVPTVAIDNGLGM